jgi:hypothetical protein
LLPGRYSGLATMLISNRAPRPGRSSRSTWNRERLDGSSRGRARKLTPAGAHRHPQVRDLHTDHRHPPPPRGGPARNNGSGPASTVIPGLVGSDRQVAPSTGRGPEPALRDDQLEEQGRRAKVLRLDRGERRGRAVSGRFGALPTNRIPPSTRAAFLLWTQRRRPLLTPGTPSARKSTGLTKNSTQHRRKSANRDNSVRPEGAGHQWRKVPPGELSVSSGS